MNWLRRFRRWNHTLGSAWLIAFSIAAFTCSDLLVEAGHALFVHFGWSKVPHVFDWNEFAVSVLSGLIVGLWEDFDRDRRKQRKLGQDLADSNLSGS